MKAIKRNVPQYPLSLHQELILRIETLVQTGSGLGRIELDNSSDESFQSNRKWVVLVPFTIPGERVRVRIHRNHANYSEAVLLEVLEPSEYRRVPKCKLFTQCGGCQLQHMIYDEQLRFKKEAVAEVLARKAGVLCNEIQVFGSPIEFGYRSKITPHFQKPRNCSIGNIGFLRHGHRSEIVDVEQCLIARDEINAILPSIREMVKANAVKYKKGATLLLRVDDVGVHTHPQEICRQRVGELEFLFPAGAFFQNNACILPQFTEYVTRVASSSGANRLLDVYCGCGVFGLCAAKHFIEVIGIEIDPESRYWAEENAKRNNITNARFISGQAEKIFTQVTCEANHTVVILDPPRAGCSRCFLEQLIRFSPKAIVYVSCHPATQARDIQQLLSAGYCVKEVAVFDLFPQTYHVESVVTLVKK